MHALDHTLIGIVVLAAILFCFPWWPLNRLAWVRVVCCKARWHKWGRYEVTGHDGCSVHARCPWCGYEGMIDSQGNLF
jgi:hypothetical protein